MNFKELETFIKQYQAKSFKKQLAEQNVKEESIKHFDNFTKIKATSIDKKNRTIEVVATKEIIDRQGDIIKLAGLDINQFMKNPVIPFGHDYGSLPVAKAIGIKFDGDELIMKLQFPTKEIYEFGDTVFKMFENGFLNAVSMGFIPVKQSYDSELNANVIEKAELLEVSIVPVPANQSALVKAYNEIVKEEKKATKGPACRQADETKEECVARKIPELIDIDGMEEEQAVAAANSICDTSCETQSKEHLQSNKEILKKYRKYQVILRDLLKIEAKEDENETIELVMKVAIGLINFTSKSLQVNFTEHYLTSEENPTEKYIDPKEATRPADQKSLVNLALKVVKDL
jgi:HK97 family phage prohead protease